jgi:hypothetical protein
MLEIGEIETEKTFLEGRVEAVELMMVMVGTMTRTCMAVCNHRDALTIS